jgi:GNAT superfamily N-acetyltransferase
MRIDRGDDQHIALWCAIWNIARPDRRWSLQDFRYEEDLDRATVRWIGYDAAARPQIAARLRDSRWLTPDAAPELDIAALPAGRWSLDAIIERAIECAADWGKRALSVGCRDSRVDGELRRALERHGFRFVEADIESALTLARGVGSKAALPEGVTVCTLAEAPELRESAHRCFELADSDEPSVDVAAGRTFEEWVREFTAPWTAWHDCFVAVMDGEVVGWANLERMSELPGVGWNGFTGTHPRARGLGIARALKHALLVHAAETGLTELRTENLETNAPILHLNAMLGYVRVGRHMWWQREVR